MIRSPVVCVCRVALALVVLPCVGAAEEASPRYVTSDGRAGVRVYAPGSWGMLGVQIDNPGDRPVEVLSATYFSGQPDLQYVRPLWIPARALLATWQPVFIPPGIPAERKILDVKSILTAGPNRKVVRSPTGQMIHDGLVQVRHDRPVMAILADPDDSAERDAAAAMCLAVGVKLPFADLQDRRLPVTMEFLDAVDQLVVASDRVGADAAAGIAIRRWLHGGGRLWILLDQVGPDTVSMLLGDAFRCHVVDRVGLTRLEVHRALSASFISTDPPRALELPVELVRVTAKGFRTTHFVNGWPAALWLPAGRGQVLLTALGARGWTRARTPADYPPSDAAAPFSVATGALVELAEEFCRPRVPTPIGPTELTGFVSEQVGYEVVSRSVVAAVLGAFCLVLAVCGLWLARIGKLEHLGWLGPSLAILTAGFLGLAGRSSRNVAPPSVAVAEVAEADPEVDDLRVTGVMAIYQPDPSKPRLGAESGGIFSLDMEGLAGTTRRMVWTDLDQWHWDNVTLPSGLRVAPFSYATAAGGRVRARAGFGPDGLTGTIELGPLSGLEDAVLTTGWSRNLGLRLTEGGRFVARTDDVLAPGQFVQGTMLTQRQQWTQQMVRSLLEDPASRQRHRTVPAVLARAAPVETHFGLLDDVERLGGALVTIPLELERPSAKTQVVIPSLFLPYRCVEFPEDSYLSSAFSNLSGEWLGPLTAPTRALLRFQCPAQVLPLRCRAAKLTVAIQAPSRTMTILGIEDGKAIELARAESPIGTKQFTIDRGAALKLDHNGGLLLGIGVGTMQGKTAGEITARGWKIDEVQLELTGETGSE